MLTPAEEIKAKLDIVDIIQEYVPNLKKAGANWKATCPFHQEKTPSFMVHPEKQIWRCFGGCNEGGDIFAFIQKIEGIEFPEALRILAKKANVVLRQVDPKLSNLKTKLLDILSQAAEYYQGVLLSPQGELALDYLVNRGITQETIKEFQVGFALESWDGLSKFLIGKGFKAQEIVQAGLAVAKKGIGVNQYQSASTIFDRFRGRIMFPIKNYQGQIIGFTGRLIQEKKDEGKYVNTPETLVYNKSRVLYGFDLAKQAIREQDLAVVAEGQMDVIASHQAGIRNVVASSGTALTQEQVKLIKRLTTNISFCFDQDAAGQEAAKRALDAALAEGMDIKLINLGEFKDPDECVKTAGKEAWEKTIKEAKPALEYFFEQAEEKYNFKDLNGKKAAAQELLPLIIKIGNQVERSFWLGKLAQKLDIEESSLREMIRKLAKKGMAAVTEELNLSTKKTEGSIVLAKNLLSLALRHPHLWEFVFNNLPVKIIPSDELQRFANHLIICYNSSQSLDWSELEKSEFSNLVGELTLLAEKEYPDLTEDEAMNELKKLLTILERSYVAKTLRLIEQKLKEAETRRDQAQIASLSQEFIKLSNRLKELLS